MTEDALLANARDDSSCEGWTGANVQRLAAICDSKIARIAELEAENQRLSVAARVHLTTEAADMRTIRKRGKRIEELEAERDRLRGLLPQAFDAGFARAIGSHIDFKQTHPSRDDWVKNALDDN